MGSTNSSQAKGQNTSPCTTETIVQKATETVAPPSVLSDNNSTEFNETPSLSHYTMTSDDDEDDIDAWSVNKDIKASVIDNQSQCSQSIQNHSNHQKNKNKNKKIDDNTMHDNSDNKNSNESQNLEITQPGCAYCQSMNHWNRHTISHPSFVFFFVCVCVSVSLFFVLLFLFLF